MSFSSEVKEELGSVVGSARHCQISELAAFFGMCGKVHTEKDEKQALVIRTENRIVAEKSVLLLKKIFHFEPAFSEKGDVFWITIREAESLERVLAALKVQPLPGGAEREDLVDSRLIQSSCCRRAFFRGAFLAGGSISNPEHSYHLEIVLTSEAKALQLQSAAASLGIDARIVVRKKYHVLYLKEGDQIVDSLGIMGAGKAFMNLENVRIVRETRGNVNRKVNCETANLKKTVSAAVEQINDILLIRDRIGLENLPENLAELAEVRLENPDASLKELTTLLSEPIGRSGVNHRLKKLREIAETFREKKGGAAK